MLSSVSITNLRGIVRGRIDGLTKVTVLAGSNNSGKSTILDALFLAAAPESINPMNIVAHRRTRRSELAYAYLTPFGGQMSGSVECSWDGVKVRYEFQSKLHQDGSGSLVHATARTANRGNGIEAWNGIPIDLLTPDLNEFASEQHSFEAVFNRVADLGSDAVQRLELLIQEAYPPVSRIITRTFRPNQGNSPYLALVVKEGSFPIHVTGDGLQRLFRIACMASTLPRGVLLLDEPECYLHPASLRLLAKIIVRASTETQVILTTHSIELVDRILGAAEESSATNDVSVHTTQLSVGQLSSSFVRGEDAERAREAVGLELR